MEKSQKYEIIKINMLGKFQLTIGDCTISNTGNRTQQVWNLLEYLIAFRNKTISQDELINALWPNDDCDNPANALKNLVYRVRTTISTYNIPFAKDIIVFTRGTYHWNNDMDCIVDTEEMEQLYRESTEALISTSEKIKLCKKAIDLYTGSFLPDSSSEQWVIPLAVYYRSIFFKCVRRCIELLDCENHYEEIINICEKAIIVDPYDELPHKYLISALSKMKKHAAALNHYTYVTDLFYRELGVRPSEDMRSLYREINKSINSIETDLEIIKEDLREHRQISGTFFCDYEVFKNLYRVESRAASRTGQCVFIGLLTITDKNDLVPEIDILNEAMDELLNVIRKSLRKGDIASRFSSTQFVLMFPSIDVEKGKNVIERTCTKFMNECDIPGIKIHSAIRPIDPIA